VPNVALVGSSCWQLLLAAPSEPLTSKPGDMDNWVGCDR
jgi:hypothetical protein